MLEMTDVAVSRDLLIRGGNGADTFNMTGGTVGRNARVRARDGDNTTSVDGTTIGRRLHVIGGAGVDALNLSNHARVTGRVEFEAQGGETNCAISDVTTGDFSLSSHVGSADISLLSSTFQGNVRIGTGAGEDRLNIKDSMFQGTTFISTGSDNDTVLIEDRLTMPGSGGSSFLPRPIKTRFIGACIIRLGTGDDQLGVAFKGSAGVAFGVAKLSGGAGSDLIRYSSIDTSSYSQFEHVNVIND